MLKTKHQVVPQYRHWYTLAALTRSVFNALSNSSGLGLIGAIAYDLPFETRAPQKLQNY